MKKRAPALVLLLTSVCLYTLAAGGTAQAACSNKRPLAFAWDPIAVPKPTSLCRFVKDEAAAIRLGKALFWDMQVGSDGIVACASCHFHAGADNRVKNQISPHGAPESKSSASFEVVKPNGTLKAGRFPFHKLQNPEDRKSAVLFDSDDVASSQGVFRTKFIDIAPGKAQDQVSVVADPVFNVGGINTRQVEPRNTMTVINAVFNTDQFWDGRGKFYFNGVNPFGLLDANARILEKQGTAIDASVSRVKVEIDMASLASQAVGPPVSASEMSGEGRPFPKIGKKLLSLVPLGKQVVHPKDSVLGSLSKDTGSLSIPGLKTTYKAMIEAAFNNKYWDSNKLFDLNQNQIGTGRPANTNQYTLMEMNFPLFWGLAIQLYESTLISDDAPYDRFKSGDTGALTNEEKLGASIFFGTYDPEITCGLGCHKAPEINKATIDHLFEFPTGIDRAVERMKMAKGGKLANGGVYDGGFYNLGVRPTAQDLGRGATVSITSGSKTVVQPLSYTRYAQANGEAANKLPSPRLSPALGASEPVAVDGAFRVPTLRNAELTGPYYHNGGLATLRDVVLFYVRGSDFREQNIDVLDNGIGLAVTKLKGRADLQEALVEFLARALTDERVRYQKAPFDHPELFVPNGHSGDASSVTDDGKGQAKDILLKIPAVGAGGATQPLKTFLSLPPTQISR